MAKQLIRPRLGVNVDHVATLREARGVTYPDPVAAAVQAELAGADQITVHLRQDRRHIQDRDVAVLRQTVQTRLNLEMGATEDMMEIALQTRPDMVTLVPEKREEKTTEGGLDVAARLPDLKSYVQRLQACGAHVSMFIDPRSTQIESSIAVGAQYVEFHTGDYCMPRSEFDSEDAFEEHRARELATLRKACRNAAQSGLRVAAGHGLDYDNVHDVAAIEQIEEFNIGHSIVCRSVFVGFDQAVREMIDALRYGRSSTGTSL